MTQVWLPESPARFGTLPTGIEADVWDGGDDLPANADQVEYDSNNRSTSAGCWILRSLIVSMRHSPIDDVRIPADRKRPYRRCDAGRVPTSLPKLKDCQRRQCDYRTRDAESIRASHS